MTKDNANSGPRMSLPGQPTEEAVADVVNDVGKSIRRGLARLGSAATSEWVAKKEAKAAAAAMAIETESKIAAERAVIDARREYEISEVDHQKHLEERRLERLKVELRREQSNLEAIEAKALEYSKAEVGQEAREIDDDWLFQYVDLAQRVSSTDVQKLWARTLNSAAKADAVSLSPQALQTLSLFDARTAVLFEDVVSIIMMIGYYPFIHDNGSPNLTDPLGLDLESLIDLGLISNSVDGSPTNLQDFQLHLGLMSSERSVLRGPVQNRYFATVRGRNIASCVLESDIEQKNESSIDRYLQVILEQDIAVAQAIRVAIGPVDQSEFVFLITQNSVLDAESWRQDSRYKMASPRLRRLLDWAATHYSITTM